MVQIVWFSYLVADATIMDIATIIIATIAGHVAKLHVIVGPGSVLDRAHARNNPIHVCMTCWYIRLGPKNGDQRQPDEKKHMVEHKQVRYGGHTPSL